MGYDNRHDRSYGQDRDDNRDRNARGRKPEGGKHRMELPAFNPDRNARYRGKFRDRVKDPATGRDKGFAFLQVTHPTNGLTYDVFLHRSCLQGEWAGWQPGDEAECSISITPSGLRAEEAELV
jgi:hypothetical protein